MNSGMYSAVSGNLAAMKRLDVIASNLANSATTGFKQDRLTFDSVLAGSQNPPEVPTGSTADPVLLQERMQTDYSNGAIVQSGNPFDLALQGDGFFVVRTPDGVAYTRQGNFRLSNDGTLVTANGYPLLSRAGGRPEEGQPIRLTELQGKPVVDSQGGITVNGEPVGALAIVDFQKPYQLKKTEGTFFVADGAAAPREAGAATTILQGALEQSNVNSVSEMINMIDANRYFESCQRVVRSFDDMAAKAISDQARV